MKFSLIHLLLVCTSLVIAKNDNNKVKGDEQLKIQRGTVRDIIPSWGPNWSVQFNLTALTSKYTQWNRYDCKIGTFRAYHNIMSFSKGPDADYAYTTRLPAFFLSPSGADFAYLHVSYNYNGSINNYWDYNLTMDKEYQVEGRLEGKKFYLFVDGKEEFTSDASNARQEDNVIFYQSNPWDHSAYSDPNNKPELLANMCKVTNLQLTSEGKEVVLKPTNEKKCPA